MSKHPGKKSSKAARGNKKRKKARKISNKKVGTRQRDMTDGDGI